MSLRKAIEQVKQNIEEDRMAGKYKKGQMIVQGQWPNPDKWAKEYIIPNADEKGVRIYAARDVYFKGRSQATKDAISQLGGPDTDYKKSPERKAAMRMRGIDRATNRLAKKEDKVSDAERKAMAAFIAKGKMKKLPPGKAAGYHGKSDPGSSMKGMISPADTKQFGTKKKVGSMK